MMRDDECIVQLKIPVIEDALIKIKIKKGKEGPSETCIK